MAIRAKFAGVFRLLLALLLTIGAAHAAEDPREMLRGTTDRMIQTLEQERAAIDAHPERLFELVESILVPQVDLERMSRWVLGKYWRQATPQQQARFSEEFKNLLVRFYVSALLDDPGQLDRLLANADALITYHPPNDLGDGRSQVRSVVHLPQGQDVPVVFSLLQEQGAWKIYDVNVEGISVVNNYRTNFASEIRRSGIEDLITRLEQRNQELLQQVNGNES